MKQANHELTTASTVS